MDTYSKSQSPTPSSSSPPPPLPISGSDTINGSHEFKISCYSLSKGIGMGKYLSSDTFMVGGHLWAVYFYPDGKSPDDNATYISIFIVLASDSTDVRALFELSLMDQSGKQQHKVHTQFGMALDGGPYMLKTRGSMWGYKRFLERTALETSDYLKDDCLLVKCTVGVVRSDIKGPEIYSTPSSTSDIDRDFGRLVEIEERTDLNL